MCLCVYLVFMSYVFSHTSFTVYGVGRGQGVSMYISDVYVLCFLLYMQWGGVRVCGFLFFYMIILCLLLCRGVGRSEAERVRVCTCVYLVFTFYVFPHSPFTV